VSTLKIKIRQRHFHGGGHAGQVKQAEALWQEAPESYENAILSAFSDVENALISRQKLADQVKAQEALVRALREYARLTWLQHNGSYRPYLNKARD